MPLPREQENRARTKKQGGKLETKRGRVFGGQVQVSRNRWGTGPTQMNRHVIEGQRSTISKEGKIEGGQSVCNQKG